MGCLGLRCRRFLACVQVLGWKLGQPLPWWLVIFVCAKRGFSFVLRERLSLMYIELRRDFVRAKRRFSSLQMEMLWLGTNLINQACVDTWVPFFSSQKKKKNVYPIIMNVNYIHGHWFSFILFCKSFPPITPFMF